jgi:hypothetical protein
MCYASSWIEGGNIHTANVDLLSLASSVCLCNCTDMELRNAMNYEPL